MAARFGVRFLGWIALILFVAMALILQIKVATQTGGFLPQAARAPYGLADLQGFGSVLKSKGLVDLYRFVLVYMDTVFFVVFAAWCVLGHVAGAIGGWRWIGIGLALAIVGLELTEMSLILENIGFHLTEQPINADAEADPGIYRITWAKYAAYVLSLASMWAISRRARA